MKILIVEDERLLADSLKTLLENKGFQAEAVYDGETGAEYAELGIYDLLILDVMMPGLDGYALAWRVRQRRCGVPILMLTARSALEDRIQGLNAGADYYLTKPFDSRELLACINALLRRQGQEVDEMTLGGRTVLGAVRIFEKVTTSALAPVTLSDLTGLGQIPADQISGYHANSSGMVDYIVLDNVTGNAYEYGMMVPTVTETTENIPIQDSQGHEPDDENWTPTYRPEKTSSTSWDLIRGIGSTIDFAPIAGYAGRSGDIVGIVSYKNREGKDMIRTILELTERTVSAKDFFQSEGSWYVTANGRNYKVASDVECYGGMGSGRVDPNSWFTQEDTGDRLSAMRAFSDALTVYIDPVGNQVRVITAG